MTKIPQIEIASQSYPYVPDRLYLGMDPVTIHGSFYMVFIPLSVFLIIFEEMLREKMLNLRLGLHVIGCSNSAFWLSWLITGVIFAALMSTFMYGFGYLFAFDIFRVAPFYVIFIMFFSVSMAYICLGSALCTLMSN